MTRWNDISDEDKRDHTWVEVTTIKDRWPVYVKGLPREPGKPMRRWEYRRVTLPPLGEWTAPGDVEATLNRLGVEGWEVAAAFPDGEARNPVCIAYVLKREVPA